MTSVSSREAFKYLRRALAIVAPIFLGCTACGGANQGQENLYHGLDSATISSLRNRAIDSVGVDHAQSLSQVPLASFSTPLPEGNGFAAETLSGAVFRISTNFPGPFSAALYVSEDLNKEPMPLFVPTLTPETLSERTFDENGVAVTHYGLATVPMKPEVYQQLLNGALTLNPGDNLKDLVVTNDQGLTTPLYSIWFKDLTPETAPDFIAHLNGLGTQAEKSQYLLSQIYGLTFTNPDNGHTALLTFGNNQSPKITEFLKTFLLGSGNISLASLAGLLPGNAGQGGDGSNGGTLPDVTPSSTPVSTENPYSTLNYFDQSTWTQAMKNAYASLPNRALGEYTQENLAIHNGLSFGMVNYLESKGITTYSNWNETNFSDYSQYVRLYAEFRDQVNSDPTLTTEQKISQVDPWFIKQILTNPINFRFAYTDSNGIIHGGFKYSNNYTESGIIQWYQENKDPNITTIQKVFERYIADAKLSGFNIQSFGEQIRIDRLVNNSSIYLQKVVDISPNPYVPNSFIITGQLDDGAYYAFDVSVGDSPLPADTQVMIDGQIVRLGDVAPGKQFIMHQAFDRQRTPHIIALTDLVEYLGEPLVIDSMYGLRATDGFLLQDGVQQIFGPLETFEEFHQQP